MTDGTKQGGKGKGGDKPEPEAVVPEPRQAQETRYPASDHIANAKAAYGESAPLVAAGIAVLEAGRANPEGYTKAEVVAAIRTAKTTEIKQEG